MRSVDLHEGRRESAYLDHNVENVVETTHLENHPSEAGDELCVGGIVKHNSMNLSKMLAHSKHRTECAT